MIKLKNLLKEGYAWERKPNKPLPTLEDVQKEYQKKKMKEVIKDKDGKVRTDLKYQSSGPGKPPKDKIVSVTGSEPYVTVVYDNGDGTLSEIEFDDYLDIEMTDPPYSGDTTVVGTDDKGNDWYVYASVDAAGGGDWNFEIDWSTMKQDK